MVSTAQLMTTFFEHQSIAQIPCDMKKMVIYLFSYRELPHETKLRSTLRRICEIVGATLTIIATFSILPLYILGSTIYRMCKPGSTFPIGNMAQPLTAESLQAQLQAVESNRFVFSRIEIVQGNDHAAFTMPAESTEQLKRLLPQELYLWNIATSPATLQQALETPRTYYQIILQNEAEETPHYLLQLRKKIKRVVLPSDAEGIIVQLEHLRDTHQKVVLLCFTSYVPEQIEEEVAALTQLIKPDFQCVIDNPRQQTVEEINAIL
jgi:hypothetical protein